MAGNCVNERSKTRRIFALSLLYCLLLLCQSSLPQSEPPPNRPEIKSTAHRINNCRVQIDNAGAFALTPIWFTERRFDAFTGEDITNGCQFPAASGVTYGRGLALHVGAIVGQDTLVSTAFSYGDNWSSAMGYHNEFSPDWPPVGDLIRRSTLDPDSTGYKDAISQEDIIAVYTDTIRTGSWLLRDDLTARRHTPLPVEVTARSYAWSYDYAEDFILFDLSIKNLGSETLEKTYIGFLGAPNTGNNANWRAPRGGDVWGFLRRAFSTVGCRTLDTVNLFWYADADGDPVNGQYQVSYDPYRSAPDAAGIRFLTMGPIEGGGPPRISFNWFTWVGAGHDWSPQHRDADGQAGRNTAGKPVGDPVVYTVMSNGELDYGPQYAKTIQPWDPIWQYPPRDVADEPPDNWGGWFLYSIGPFRIPPGSTLPLAFAYVFGEKFHHDPYNIRNLPDDPWTYEANLDFSSLIKNATWADWIYDTPGVDTDSDGYAGEYKICVHDSTFVNGYWQPTIAETTWVKGDGVPDWKAAGPPPAPTFWVTPLEGGIHIRFNGYRSETEVDVFSRIRDFEGYRVYLGRDTHRGSMSLVASYDREDYDKWVFRTDIDTVGVFQLQGAPFTIDSLRCLYGHGDDPCNDMTFDPLSTSNYNPYHNPDFPDSLYFFTKHNDDVSEFGITTPITKIYPDAPDPSQWPADSIPDEAYTEDHYLKYYEYEFTITDLLATVPYWVNVTAFDFGAPIVRLDPLETSRTLGAKEVYPYTHGGPSTGGKLNVYIYPNPYRIDGGYRKHGYEGRMREDRPDNRVREINFENLPPKCTISIYSLDGDLICSIDHDVPETDPNYHHDSWDMITRNTQEPVSGLYYWVVEASNGQTQIGRLVLIM